MAVTPGVGSIWRYTITGLRAGQRWQIGTYLSPPSDLTPADYVSWCTSFLAYQEVYNLSPLAQLLTMCPVEVSVDQHVIQAIYPNRLVSVGRLPPVGLRAGGLDGTQILPVNSCAAWERYTELGTRAGHGSLHPPCGYGEYLVAGGGTWDPTFANSMNTVLAYWSSPFLQSAGSPTMYPVLWNKANPTKINRILGWKTNPYVRTLRRRTVLVGK